MRLRSILLIFAILVVTAAVFALASAGKSQRPRCANCGMFVDTSSTRIEATLKAGKKTGTFNFVCLDCIQEYNDENFDGKAQLTALKIVDYNSFVNNKPLMIDGKQAYYLYGTSALPGSMPPFIAAFKTKADAEKAKNKLGGTVMDFSTMWTKLTAGDSDEKAQAGDIYVCKMCNYKTDKPGNCPHCGMKLEKA